MSSSNDRFLNKKYSDNKDLDVVKMTSVVGTNSRFKKKKPIRIVEERDLEVQ